MLALDFVKANREAVERAISDKGVELDLSHLLELDSQVRALKTDIDGLRAERNAASAKFKRAAPEEKAELGRRANSRFWIALIRSATLPFASNTLRSIAAMASRSPKWIPIS